MKQHDLWYADEDSRNLKGGWSANFYLGVIKNTLNQSNFEILKASIFQEQQGPLVGSTGSILPAELD